MTKISIDFETTSPVDLPRCGVHVYAQDPRTEVLCCAYSIDGGPPKIWKRGEKIPPEFLRDDVHFYAWNAQFERIIWRDCLRWPDIPLNRWHCTMASAAAKGLPLHLADAAAALKTETQKDEEGRALMKRVSKMKADDISPEELNRLALYCQRDVLVEQEIDSLIGPLIGSEYSVWCLDQQINDRGLNVNRELVDFLSSLTSSERKVLEGRLYELTDGRITSLHQHVGIRKWLSEKGVFVESMNANSLRELEECWSDAVIKEIVAIRLDGAKSSLAKLEAMQYYDSGRLRGLFQYHGAVTGRWAGRGVQLQNFPRAVPNPPVEEIMKMSLKEAADFLRNSSSVMSWASAALRSCIIPSEGLSLYVADYSQIETRILAWLADDVKFLRLFSEGVDPYVAFAASMYKISPDAVTKQQRQIAKSAVLGLGYGMGAQRYMDYASTYGVALSLKEAERIVTFYRMTHVPVVNLWKGIERAAARAIHHGKAEKFGRVWFFPSGKNLVCRLPSGRELTYWDVRIEEYEDRFAQITYMKRDQVSGQWVRRKLYGGLLVENIVQGTARDVMVHGMREAEAAGFQVVGTVHDEILAEGEPKQLEKFLHVFDSVPEWIGIVIPVEGREGKKWSK